MEDEKTFLGRGWGFPPAFEKEIKGVKMIANEEDINSSLEILLTTNLGERFLQPDYGCGLSELVFDPQNASEAYIKDLIQDAILFHEPRIELEGITMEPQGNDGWINIEIRYTVIATNTRYNYVYPFYLNEATNLNL